MQSRVCSQFEFKVEHLKFFDIFYKNYQQSWQKVETFLDTSIKYLVLQSYQKTTNMFSKKNYIYNADHFGKS